MIARRAYRRVKDLSSFTVRCVLMYALVVTLTLAFVYYVGSLR